MLRKSLILGIVLSFCVSVLLAQTAVAPSAGDGSRHNPYIIATLENLYWIAAHDSVVSTPDRMTRLSSCYIQIAEINAALTSEWNSTDAEEYLGWDPIGNNHTNCDSTRFCGNYDGNGYVIRNLFINRPDTYNVGLFGYVSGDSAQIKNLTILDVDLTGYENVGGLVGFYEGDSISNCYTTGRIAGIYGNVGGLVGYNEGGNITNCQSYVNAEAEYACYGGLVGRNTGRIRDCHSNGIVSAHPDHGSHAGGLVGWNKGNISYSHSDAVVIGHSGIGGLVGSNVLGDARISCCYSTGDVDGSRGNHTGGLVGYNLGGAISDCYSTGDVEALDQTGGLVGYNSRAGSIFNCYSIGCVTGSSAVGGLVGLNDGGSISDCFWDVETSNQDTSDGGDSKTTADMKTLSTFTDAGWDYNDIWAMDGGINEGYPYLIYIYTVYTLPSINHLTLINIDTAAFTASAEITDPGNPAPFEHGFCWDTNENPTIDDNIIKLGIPAGIGVFPSDITGLTPNTTYYVRAYVTNALGTAYSHELPFTTTSLPSVGNLTIISIDTNGVSVSAEITDLGNPALFQNGFCWSGNNIPTIEDHITDLVTTDSIGNFNALLYGLNPDTRYYIRAFAINTVGIAYSDTLSFATLSTSVNNILPEQYALLQNHPNPFNPTTTLQYGLPEAADARLMIFDITGRKIKEWSIGNQQPGWHEVVWDGTNQSGQQVSTGVYIYSLRAGDFVDTKKMVFMK